MLAWVFSDKPDSTGPMWALFRGSLTQILEVYPNGPLHGRSKILSLFNGLCVHVDKEDDL